MNKNPYCRHLWYSRNILQWNKNNIKSTRMTNEDYLTIVNKYYISEFFFQIVSSAVALELWHLYQKQKLIFEKKNLPINFLFLLVLSLSTNPFCRNLFFPNLRLDSWSSTMSNSKVMGTLKYWSAIQVAIWILAFWCYLVYRQLSHTFYIKKKLIQYSGPHFIYMRDLNTGQVRYLNVKSVW